MYFLRRQFLTGAAAVSAVLTTGCATSYGHNSSSYSFMTLLRPFLPAFCAALAMFAAATPALAETPDKVDEPIVSAGAAPGSLSVSWQALDGGRRLRPALPRR